jgi:hypothetical protein
LKKTKATITAKAALIGANARLARELPTIDSRLTGFSAEELAAAGGGVAVLAAEPF